MDSSPKKCDISKRILETRKQTEELKAQLQTLIDSGINSSLEYNKLSDHSNFDKENIKESQNKVQIIKSYDAKHSHHINKPSSSKVSSIVKQKDKKIEQNPKKESPTKVRSYDVNEAREYIKKQREKRLEQLKFQNNDKTKAELQKQKLLELHKKSLELVTKNVQKKRERSKSRDRMDYIRPDQNIPTRNRSLSRERNYLGNGRSHSKENIIGKPIEPSKNIKLGTVEGKNSLCAPSDCIVRLQKTGQKTKSMVNHSAEITQKSTSEPYSLNRNSVENKADNISKYTLRSESNIDIVQKSLRPVNLFNLPHEKSGSVKARTQNTEEKIIMPVNNILDYKSSQSDRSSRDMTLSPSKGNLEPVKLNVIQSNDLKLDQGKLISKRSEVAISTDNLEKDSKETQTNYEQTVEFPLWLQERPVQAYPFNFINTVKRKLHHAVSSPKPLVEVGVQSSFGNEISKSKTPENVKIKDLTKEEIFCVLQHSSKSIKKSDLKSFISHKCLNLDLKAMDHLELVPKKNNRRSQTVTKVSEIESESDTSKDIPDISSESGTSLRKNADSIRKSGASGLNVGKISSMKLIPHNAKSVAKNTASTVQSEMEQYSSKLRQTEFVLKPTKNVKNHRSESRGTIGRESKETSSRNILTVDNQYISDFQSGTDLSRSRESIISSIISYNSPTYNKIMTHSFDKNPENNKSTDDESILYSEKHSIYIPEKISMHSEMHSKAIPENISLRNSDQEKYSKSLLHNPRKDKIGETQKKLLERIPANTELETATNSRNYTNGVTTTSNNKETISSSSIATERISQSSDKNTEESHKVLSKSSARNSKISKNYTSLYTEFHSSASNNGRMSKSDSNLRNINTHRGSSNYSESDKLTEVFPLKEPVLSLTIANKETVGKYEEKNKSRLTKNISLRSDRNRALGDLNDTNEIHLKFEAEIHLLNDFNESLRQFSAVEKAFESLKSKNDNDVTVSKILQNRDTQTSIQTQSSTSTKVTENVSPDDRLKSQVSTINYSRGSIINVDSTDTNLDNTTEFHLKDNNSLLSAGMEISNLNKSTSSVVNSNPDLSNFENLHSSNFAGMSLRMFEQLIKDEDVRLENLKTILKIREQALLDRTKGELAWLEIQRKYLRETGKLHEASLIKKKQRGILVNHQKEKHEMQRLKQMQKAASLERKIILKEQRNLIKHQLSTDNMLSKMKVNTPRERRLSGPLKVVQSHSESIRSETSISRKSSSDKDKDVYTITSHTHSVVSKTSELSGDEMRSIDVQSDVDAAVDLASRLASEACGVPISKMKKSLLMREAALQKRRRAAEELLQWHKKLLEEEKRITELELAANAIISHIPKNVSASTDVEEKYKFKGKQLNQLWFNLTGCEVKKFAEEKIYPMSQIALERFCMSARHYSSKTKKILRKVSDSDINSDYSELKLENSISENIPDQKDILSASIKMEVEQSRKQSSSGNEVIPTVSLNDYASDFDVESIEEIVSEDVDVVDQSINRLIDNFSKIKEDISSLSLKQSWKSGVDPEQNDSQKSEKTDSDIEISVIETNKTSKEDEEKSKSEEVNLKLSEDKISTSNKNSSTIEEIKRSTTKDNTNKSEDVLLRLYKAEEKSQKSSSAEEFQVSDEEETSSNYTDEGVLSLKHTCDKISTDVSEIDSNKNSSEVEEKSKENFSSSKDKEIVLKLSQSEDRISTDVSSNKNSSIIKDRITCEGKDNLNKTEEILGRLSQLEDEISTNTSCIKQSLGIEENQVTSKEKDNVTKSEDILQRLNQSEGKISTDVSRGGISSSNEIKENHMSVKGKNSLSIAKEIVSSLNQSEDKINTDISSDILSSQKSLVNEENDISNEGKYNLSNTEEILERLSKAIDIISTDTSKDTTTSKESSLIEENKSSVGFMDNLNKTEEILLRLEREKDKSSSEKSSKELNRQERKVNEDGSSNKISSIMEENETYSEENRTEEEPMKLVEKEGTSTDGSKDISAADKSSVIVESQSTNKSKENLNNTEEILNLQNDRVRSETSTELNKSESKENGDDSSNKISSVTEENEEYSEKNKLEEEFAKLHQDGISSDDALTQNVSASKKASSKESKHLLNKNGQFSEDKLAHSARSGDDSSVKTLESLKETDIDEELSIDEEAINQHKNNHGTHEIIKINDEETELEEKISKAQPIKNKDVSSETTKTSEVIVESEKESDPRKTKSTTPENTSKESVITASENEKPHLSLGQNNSKQEDLSQITVSDVYTEIEESDKSLHEDPTCFSKEDINSYEEKEQDSLSSSATSGSQSSVATEKKDKLVMSDRSKSSISEEKSARSGVVDVKKRVSEIMADASQLTRGDKSPRLQDLYITTYDLVSPANSPELGSPVEENKLVTTKSVFGTEAEELLRKQLAIEQEIKQITEQQQKEQLPFLFVREIPNKPPPPYIPPSSLPPVNVITIIPTIDEIEDISKYSAKILHKAYLANNLDNISISEKTLGLISKNITKECYKFVFDLCKEISKEHYKKFEKEKCPSWLQVAKRPQLTVVKPLDVGGLEKHMNKNLKELFGYEKPERRENAIIKWSRKNRDHVDEILVMESQAEEVQWTSYDKDELLVMNDATNDIMNMLLKETGQVFSKILSKRTYLF